MKLVIVNYQHEHGSDLFSVLLGDNEDVEEAVRHIKEDRIEHLGADVVKVDEEHYGGFSVGYILVNGTSFCKGNECFTIHITKEPRTPDDRWESNKIQFARLLSEIAATQPLDIASLASSMDLCGYAVNELFDRAQKAWEEEKENLRVLERKFTKPSTRVRPIEVYCCYDDHTWQCEHFVEIPEDTPHDYIEELALRKAKEVFTDDSIVFIGLYSIPEDWADWPQQGDEP